MQTIARLSKMERVGFVPTTPEEVVDDGGQSLKFNLEEDQEDGPMVLPPASSETLHAIQETVGLPRPTLETEGSAGGASGCDPGTGPGTGGVRPDEGPKTGGVRPGEGHTPVTDPGANPETARVMPGERRPPEATEDAVRATAEPGGNIAIKSAEGAENRPPEYDPLPPTSFAVTCKFSIYNLLNLCDVSGSDTDTSREGADRRLSALSPPADGIPRPADTRRAAGGLPDGLPAAADSGKTPHFINMHTLFMMFCDCV